MGYSADQCLALRRVATAVLPLILSVATGATPPVEPQPNRPDLPPAEKELLAEIERLTQPSLWTSSASARLGVGYRDNVLLSDQRPETSALITIGGDLAVQRPGLDGTEVSILLTGDYTHVRDSAAVDYEALALARAEVKRELGGAWSADLVGQYVFFHQVYDVSATEAELRTVTARGHLGSLSARIACELGRPWTASASVEGARDTFESPLDSYWRFAPGARLEHKPSRRLDWSLEYRYDHRAYDERPPLDAFGSRLPGRLEFAFHEAEARARVYWDAARQWSLRVRGGAGLNFDNGGGYFDYTRYHATLQLRYQPPHWSLRAEWRWRHYDYDLQPAGATGSPARSKTDLGMSLRGERTLGRKWTVFAQYDYEAAQDNLPRADYTVNTVWLGLEREL